MRLWLHLGFGTLIGLISVLLVSGCQNSSPEEAQRRQAALHSTAEKIFEDDFERTSIGPHWKRGNGESGQGEWVIKDGWLYGYDLKNDPLWLEKSLPSDVLVQFDAQALSPIGDVKFEIFGDGETHASGYICILGGWENQLDVTARLDEHGDDRREQQTIGVMPRTTYNMTVWRQSGTLHWFVGDRHVLSYKDGEPLSGPGHRHFGFNVWSAPVRFDNVEIYRMDESS